MVDPNTEARIAAVVGVDVVDLHTLGGGYTKTGIIRANLSNGLSVVAKIATDQRTASEIRFEADVLGSYRLGCMPELIGFDDAEAPLLLLEDLSSAQWPPPWLNPGLLFSTITEVGSHEAPAWIPSLRDDRLPSWDLVMSRRREVVATGVVSDEWLTSAAARLDESAASISVEGNALLHADIWSGNVCFNKRGAVLIDWAGAAAGNSDYDLGTAYLDVYASTERLPAFDWPGRRAMSAVLAAMKCHAVTLGTPDWATPDWHDKQVEGLSFALQWAAREHDLPDPAH